MFLCVVRINILYSCPIIHHSHVSYPGNTHRRVKKLLAKPWLANIIYTSALAQMREWFVPLYMMGRGWLQFFRSSLSFVDLWSNNADLALVSLVSVRYRRRYRYAKMPMDIAVISILRQYRRLDRDQF